MLASASGDPSEAGQLPPSLERQEFPRSGGGDGEGPEVAPYGSELGNVDSEVASALEGRFDDEETSVPLAKADFGVQCAEAAGRQDMADGMGNTGDGEDDVPSEDDASSRKSHKSQPEAS